MPVFSRSAERHWTLLTRRQSLIRYLIWLAAIILVVISFRFISGQTIWMFVSDAPRQAADLVSRMFPP